MKIEADNLKCTYEGYKFKTHKKMEANQENITLLSVLKKITLKKIFRGNPNIWTAILVLALISIFASISVSRLEKFVHYGNEMQFWVKHACFIVISFFIIVFFQFFPLNIIKKYSKLIWLISLLIVLITMIFGERTNEATRSIFGLRTFDIMKLAFPLFFAKLLAEKISDINISFKKCLQYVVVPGVISFGIFIKDNISTGIIIGAVFAIMLIVSDVKLKYKFYISSIFIGLIVAALFWHFTIGEKYPIGRLNTALGRLGINLERTKDKFIKDKDNKIVPYKNKKTEEIKGGDWNTLIITTYYNNSNNILRKDTTKKEINEQIKNGIASIQSAGLLPKGPGQSAHKNSLTQVEDDFIFSLVAEEWGLIVGIIVIGCYLSLFIISTLTIGKLNDKYSVYLVLGIISYITIQAMIHFIVNVGGPATGQTLPFVSNGKTSIIITAISFGLIINANSNVLRKTAKKEKAEKMETKTKAKEIDISENNVRKIIENLD